MLLSNRHTNSREKKISQRTYDRVNIAKSYIEKKYKMKKEKEEEKKKGKCFILHL
jgi:hypothetical protein